MKLGDFEIPEDWLVRIDFEVYTSGYEIRSGTVGEVFKQDYDAIEVCDYHSGDLVHCAELKISTLPDCVSDSGDEGEFLETLDLRSQVTAACPVYSAIRQRLTGCIGIFSAMKTCRWEAVPVSLLKDVRLENGVLFLGGRVVEMRDFEEQSSEPDIDGIDWYIDGECVDRVLIERRGSLLQDFWNDLDYILAHTRVPCPKATLSINADLGRLFEDFLRLVASMPSDRRRWLLCDHVAVDDAFRRHAITPME